MTTNTVSALTPSRKTTTATKEVLAEILGGDSLTLTQAARMVPSRREGTRAAPSTVFRWLVNGLADPSGQVIRLEGVRLGRNWLTSGKALERFLAAVAGVVQPEPEPTPCPAPAPVASRSEERRGKDLQAGLDRHGL